ncbi:MAG: hypothetical protein JSW17_04220 [Candidatus Omnitrophota bacterium]|nr:MAG: hypothetical protein JSW17_04220 [Candidatus Omnitrophota bacterium]
MCYSIPLAGAAITHIVWARKRSVKLWWLNLMFYGAALFGVIDHWWNGELFLVSENVVKDLLLGVTITITTLLVWGIMVVVSKTNPTLASYTNISK